MTGVKSAVAVNQNQMLQSLRTLMFSTPLEDLVIQKLNDELAPYITKTVEASI
jgi:hypothetical protein